MTIINPKSIAGVTSITTPSGSDNLFTVHTNNTTERVRINNDGDVIVGSGITVSPDGDIFTTGVTTSTTFVGALTGNVTGNATGLSGTPNISAGTIAGSTGTFTGDVDIADKIVHTGDTDTAIRFSAADTVSVETGGSQKLSLGSATVFNETGADVDFRVESDTNTHALFLNAGNSKIGINNSSPNEELSVAGNVEISSGASILKISSSSPSVRFTDTDASGGYGVIGVNNTSGSLVMRSDDGNALSSTYMGFEVDGGEKMRISSNGNLLINTTSELGGSNPQLQVGDTTDAEIYIGNTSTSASGECNITFGPSNSVTTSIIRGYAIEDASSSAAQTGGLKFFIREDGNFKESFRLTREGNVNIAEATDSNTAKLDCTHSGNNGGAGAPTYVCRLYQATNNTGTDHACLQLRHNAATGSQDGVMVDFKNASGSSHGSIKMGASSVSFNTTSDYRLKENVAAISDGIARIKTLKPYKFNWIVDETNTPVDGFFAHEVSDAVPEAVSGTKDETQNVLYRKEDTIPDGKAIGDVKEVVPAYQSIDQSKLVPLLTAALQEAVTKIEVLETRLNNAGIAT